MEESEPNPIQIFQIHEALDQHLTFNNNPWDKINLQTLFHEKELKVKICSVNHNVDVVPRLDLHQSREKLFKMRCLSFLVMLEVEATTFSTSKPWISSSLKVNSVAFHKDNLKWAQLTLEDGWTLIHFLPKETSYNKVHLNQALEQDLKHNLDLNLQLHHHVNLVEHKVDLQSQGANQPTKLFANHLPKYKQHSLQDQQHQRRSFLLCNKY